MSTDTTDTTDMTDAALWAGMDAAGIAMDRWGNTTDTGIADGLGNIHCRRPSRLVAKSYH